MILCFGTFAAPFNVILRAPERSTSKVTQTVFFSQLIKCITVYSDDTNEKGLIDVSCVNPDDLKTATDGEIFNIDGKDYYGNSSVISRLLSCERHITRLPIFDNMKYDFDLTADNIDKYISGYFTEDEKSAIILMLIDIIRRDTLINTEQKYAFKTYFGMDKLDFITQEKFSFAELITRCLLYTICGINNRKGSKEIVNEITNDYCSDLLNRFKYEYFWDDTTKSLEFSCNKMYNIFLELIKKYRIDYFIGRVDPTNGHGDFWIGVFDSFNRDIYNLILMEYSAKKRFEQDGFTLKNIGYFNVIFSEYTSYLGENMCIPEYVGNIEKTNCFVPKFRNKCEEFKEFSKKVKSYRNRLLYRARALKKHLISDNE